MCFSYTVVHCIHICFAQKAGDAFKAGYKDSKLLQYSCFYLVKLDADWKPKRMRIIGKHISYLVSETVKKQKLTCIFKDYCINVLKLLHQIYSTKKRISQLRSYFFCFFQRYFFFSILRAPLNVALVSFICEYFRFRKYKKWVFWYKIYHK